MRNRTGNQKALLRLDLNGSHRFLLTLLAVACFLIASGCSRFNKRSTPTTPAFSSDTPTADQVVAQINRNAERVQGLIARDLDISSNQAPIPLDGRLALEKPRRFRLVVKMPATKTTVADIGSNDEEFWFYTAQPTQQASLIHCSYEDYGKVQMRIPIQPEWIFDALGFMPLPADQRHMLRPGSKRGSVELVSSTITPQGQNGSLITVVQLDTGWIVERRLELPGRPQPLAVATLSRHQKDPATGVVYPGTVRVAWPEDDLDITMRMQGVEINPRFDPAMAQGLWQLPRNYSAQDIDLGAGLRTNRVQRPPSAQLSPPPGLVPPVRHSRIQSAYP